ncbi:hypothetical protein [Conexibacter sp. CPCC 206217]|uniref:hypothetical protein n=1 Tax=Conexibacter sp. CPCC 206217 TaxID=3064574 RepID=UPI0027179B02|nr:hypothetical protein [Conexibacter sp. CPCC 206217]MDO8212365.1 hypothetical protein [Conexibacter sp. CPCC 206217]
MTLAAAPAFADCGSVHEYPARKDIGPGLAPLAIGDSAMLLALPDLARAGFDANAHGCRDMHEGLALLRARAAAGALPDVVVIALGANASIDARQVSAALHRLGRTRRLVLVTPRELGGWSGEDARTVRAFGKRLPRRVGVLDWVAHSRGHTSWFQPDGLHLTFDGARAFTKLLARALPRRGR